MQTVIIGIAGTNGAGKDTVGLLLGKNHNFLFVSVTDIMRDELRMLGQPVDREHLRSLSKSWREAYGLGVLVDKALAVYHEASRSQSFDGLVLASIRNVHEVERIHQLGGQVWWIDADERLRYDRIQANAAARGRAGEDVKSFAQFQAEEAIEMHGNGDPAALDMSAVKRQVDRELTNGGQNVHDLEVEIADIIANKRSA